MATLKDIVAVSGKAGLYKILQPMRTGVILESLDDKKNKVIGGNQQRMSVLSEISIYTTTKEGSEPLFHVLRAIQEKYGKVHVEVGSEPKELFAFLANVLPNYDTERVYASDVKKLVTWYNIIIERCPEALDHVTVPTINQ